MRKSLCSSVFVVILGLAASCFALGSLRVDERAVRIEFQTGGTAITLTIENTSHNPVSAHLRLELIDPQGKLQGQAERDVNLPPGATQAEVTLPPVAPRVKNESRLLWYRLRYSVSGPPRSDNGVSGILSVGALSPGIFALHVATPRSVKEGDHFVARVRAIQPLTLQAVDGVTIQAKFNPESDEGQPQTREALTDRNGFATIPFSVPQSVNTDILNLSLQGKLGGYSTGADGSLSVLHSGRIALSTDKPIYQPGQTLHIRLLAFDASKRAIAREAVIFRIRDPEDTIVYRAEAQTSRFGIASADWQIPDNLRLGSFIIQAAFKDEWYADSRTNLSVRISRYELPTFIVTAKADRNYYLPGQNANIEIRANYLFGKPVIRGHVRLVRETEREWNFREQKYDIKVGATYEGDTNRQGLYVARVNLSSEFKSLETNNYEYFQDPTFAAYFTDSSTGRTEQRRFDIRLTKQPIHIHIIRGGLVQVKGLPLEFYVSTDYADGTPTSCDVKLYKVTGPTQESGNASPHNEQYLRGFHTNRYGVAKIDGLTVPNESERDKLNLRFVASDAKGNVGSQTATLWFDDQPGIWVETDKTLYKIGEPITAKLTTSRPKEWVVVEAIHDSEVLSSKLIRLSGRHATVVLGPGKLFQNEVTILAYSFGNQALEAEYGGAMANTRTVLFPKPHGLRVDIQLAKNTYRPGEQASINFHVTGPDGKRTSSALGLVAVDEAVQERARTDREFGEAGGFYGFGRHWEETAELSGVRLSDLENLDLSKTLPEGLELVAEILLQSSGAWPNTFGDDSGEDNLRDLFSSEIGPTMAALRKSLDARYNKTKEYPNTEPVLARYLADAGIHFEALKDPWGTSYLAVFGTDRQRDTLEIRSAGPDKKFGTDDDFQATQMGWPYFAPYSDAIRRAVNTYHTRTGGYIRDRQTLEQELAKQGIEFNLLRDHWGHPYRLSFGIDRTQYTVTVASAGPDGYFDSIERPSHDDFSLASIGMDYFSDSHAQIDAALSRYFVETQGFPENTEQFRIALHNSGISWNALKDPWDHSYYATFRKEPSYADTITAEIETYAEHVSGSQQQVHTLPVTRHFNWIYIRSAGEDGVEGTPDDFSVATFARAVVEQSAQDKNPVATKDKTIYAESRGAISGTVTDPSGAVLPHGEVSASNSETGYSATATTDNDGKYFLRNLPPGYYAVHFTAPGFKKLVITQVPVQALNATTLDVVLAVGTVTQNVMVSGTPARLETSSAAMADVTNSRAGRLSRSPRLSTPRLREYFPETLLWRPELLTDENGRATLKFPLADSITTWKLSAVASTLNGELGFGEKEIRTFQPFFVEDDPPRYLTTDDEIALPVILRNYTKRQLPMKVQMASENWFDPLGSTTATVEIPPLGTAGRAFWLRAKESVKVGKQKVIAQGAGEGDAIERTVTVRPKGQEKTQTIARVFDDGTSFQVQIPADALPGSIEAKLKVYPNLNAHVLESIEGILARPYGCAEQIISSAYPSILFLRYAKGLGRGSLPDADRARRYVQLGYERLLSYRAPGGGFSYWGRGEADPALTAYAVKFLSDASEFANVDDSVIADAVSWLVSVVQKDGRWIARDWKGNDVASRSAILTACITRMIAQPRVIKQITGTNPQLAKLASLSVSHGLAYAQRQAKYINDPYFIASYTLAALDFGDKSLAAQGLEALRAMERREGTTSYWALEMNTPFYGWGLTGRVETTALVLQALTKGRGISTNPQGLDEVLSRGLLFLLRNEDRYGVWYSTQATVNVLDALASLSSTPGGGLRGLDGNPASGSSATVSIDGKEVISIDLPPAGKISGPITTDLTRFLSPGTHSVEIRRPPGSARASLQLVTDFYVPWKHTAVGSNLHQEPSASDALRLAVHFDKETSKVGEAIKCTVTAERIGFRGYGMMLAEIGLPPGVDVDRSSLDDAMKASAWDINQYDLLPDRLIFYLWPRAGGTTFSFDFKPRLALKALTAPSKLYDYYNPEMRAVVEPTLFKIEP